MFLLQILPLLPRQVLQILTQPPPRVPRLDNIIHEPPHSRRERVTKLGRVLCLAGGRVGVETAPLAPMTAISAVGQA